MVLGYNEFEGFDRRKNNIMGPIEHFYFGAVEDAQIDVNKAKKVVDDLTTQKASVDTNLKNKKSKLEKANNVLTDKQLNNVQEAVDEAQKAVNAAQTEVNDALTELTTIEKKLGDAETKLEEANTKLQSDDEDISRSSWFFCNWDCISSLSDCNFVFASSSSTISASKTSISALCIDLMSSICSCNVASKEILDCSIPCCFPSAKRLSETNAISSC